MTVSFSKLFLKQAKKLDPKLRKKLHERIALFVRNPFDASLRNHPLKGPYKDYRSIDITGDVRALYLMQDDEAIFDAVGTHGQLYG